MRNDDMFRESIKNKDKLVPDSYSQRISDLLASLPDEMPCSEDTEAAVINHKPRIINIRALVSAAAAFAVVFAAVISVSQIQKTPFDKNHDDEGKRYAVTTVTVTEVSETTTETQVTSSETVVSEKTSDVPAEAGVTTLIQGEKKTDAENTAVYPAVTKVAEKTAPSVSGVTLPAHTAPVVPGVTKPGKFPDRPDIPGNPNIPENPGSPDNPGNPNKPDNPYDPDYPDNHDRPDNPGHENENKIPFVTEPDDWEDRPGYDRDEDWDDEHDKDNERNEFEEYDDFSDLIEEYEKIKKEREEKIESESEKTEKIIRKYEEQE